MNVSIGAWLPHLLEEVGVLGITCTVSWFSARAEEMKARENRRMVVFPNVIIIIIILLRFDVYNRCVEM